MRRKVVAVSAAAAALLTVLHLLPAPAATGLHGAAATGLHGEAAAHSTASASVSQYWGMQGEAWKAEGPIMDFSFAGYLQGNEPLPTPPITRGVLTFKRGGMSDTQVLQAALDWAHKQPVTDGYIVLYIPEGQFTLTEMLHIRRPRLVLRGAGSNKTSFWIPKSLTELYGAYPEGTGGWIFYGGFVTFEGSVSTTALTDVVGSAARGATRLEVRDASSLEVGQYYLVRWTDIDGKFANSMFDGLIEASAKSRGSSAVNYANRVVAIQGNTVTFERAIPYAIWREGTVVRLYRRQASVSDSGVEGITFKFKWELYGGHHLEMGWNALDFRYVIDCWARDIATVNVDNAVVMTGSTAITVKGLKLTATASRKNRVNKHAGFDGHWGVHHTQSYDILVDGFDYEPDMYHGVGAGSSGMFSVFMNGRMRDGNMELHRALAGPALFTNIDVGVGSKALYSGGPTTSGPSTQSNTTYWNIRSNQPILPPDNNQRNPPGDCVYGSHINLIGIQIIAKEAAKMCKNWRYEPQVTHPTNLYEAQLARRLGPTAIARRLQE